MPAATTSLPCRAHRECTYHKHWTSAPSLPSPFVSAPNQPLAKNSSTLVNINTTAVDAPKDVKPKRLSIFRPSSLPARKVTLAPSQTTFRDLPTELLLSIFAHLSPVSQASLALTCRSFALILGPSAWNNHRKHGHANWVLHDGMLDILQRDLSSDAWWRCPECSRYHPRRKTMPKELVKASNIHRVMDFRAKLDENKSLRIGDPKDPVYILNFNLLKVVMDRHFQGAPYGMCLNSLRCRGTRLFPVSDTSKVELRYETLPKIVLDRLLLQVTYTFTPLRTMFIRNMAVADVSTLDFLQHLDFWICGHLQCGAAVIQASSEASQALNLKSRTLHCKYCPTQYSVNTSISLPSAKSKVIEIKAWHNLGSGKSAKEVKWMHIARRGKEKKLYKWGKMNVKEAFERILCSTTEEFERQLERSDGAGSWYDPELKKRAYKTLPVNLAGRL